MSTLQNHQEIFTKNIASLINYTYEQGYTLTLGEAYRTAEQAEIYAKEGKGIVHSLHIQRLAVDFNLFKDGVYMMSKESYEPLGAYWKTLHPNNRWGGDFVHLVDSNHFEMQNI